MNSLPVRILALLGAMLLTLAACGGESTSTTPTLPTVNAAETSDSTTTTTEAVDPEEAFQQYSECMRENGVDLPDPGSVGDGSGAVIIGGDDVDFAALEKASEACDSILEGAFGEFEMTPEQEVELRDRELAFAKCMRDNGVDWPDPSGDPSGESIIELPDNLNPEDLNSAMEVCSKDAFGSGGGFHIGSETP